MNRIVNLVLKLAEDLNKLVSVLIVEDHKGDQVLQRMAVEAAGANVDIAANSDEVLSLIRKRQKINPVHPYDLILLDLKLTGSRLQGPELRTEIGHLAPEVPVAIVTGDMHNPELHNAAKRGYIGIIEKPLVIEKIQQVFSHHRIKRK